MCPERLLYYQDRFSQDKIGHVLFLGLCLWFFVGFLLLGFWGFWVVFLFVCFCFFYSSYFHIVLSIRSFPKSQSSIQTASHKVKTSGPINYFGFPKHLLCFSCEFISFLLSIAHHSIFPHFSSRVVYCDESTHDILRLPILHFFDQVFGL